VLVGAVTTSISGAGRLAYSLGRHDMLPHAFGVLRRRTLIAPVSIVSAAAVASGLLLLALAAEREVRFLASLYSFGVLIAFTAAQAAVIRLRFKEPDLPRPFRAPGNIRLRGIPVPLAALIGAPLTLAIWICALATHEAAQVAGPLWLLVGLVVFVTSRWSAGQGLLKHVQAPADLMPDSEGAYERILVPLKLGPIGEEVLATAIRLASERNGQIDVLHVLRVPLDRPLEAEVDPRAVERAESSLREAKTLAGEHGVTVHGEVVRARTLGEAIVRKAREDGADLIVMGSAARWRRQSRFFSPTVDFVLRRAPCEVMVVAYPQGVLEEEAERDSATLTP